MIEKPKLGPNDEEVDDYRDFDDEHSERGSKLDDFAEEDEEDMDEITPETPSAAPTSVSHGTIAPTTRKVLRSSALMTG